MTKTTRFALLSSVALFVTLGTWSIGSSIGSGGDIDYHISSIWCGWGESPGICEDYGLNADVYSARVPYMFQMCNGRPLDSFPSCTVEKSSDKMQVLRSSGPDTKTLYYKIMRLFVSTSPVQSIVLMRIFNSLLTSVMFLFLLILPRGRIRLAMLSGWTFTLVPVAVQTFPTINPKSWALLGAMSAWAFLHTFLVTKRDDSRRRVGALFLYGVSFFLAAATRIDATIFVIFSSLLVILVHLIHEYQINFKKLLAGITLAVLLLLVSLQVPTVKSFSRFRPPTVFPFKQYLLFQLTHIPESLAEVWGYSVGQGGNGPGIIGIIGLSLFVLCWGIALQHASRTQILLVAIMAIFIFSTVWRGSISIGSMVPAAGHYVLALMTILLGLTILYSQLDAQFMSSRANRLVAIGLLSFSHAQSLFSYMEFYVRGGHDVGMFVKLSLSGGWWWGPGINPNFVFLTGAICFPVFLIFAWKSVIGEQTQKFAIR